MTLKHADGVYLHLTGSDGKFFEQARRVDATEENRAIDALSQALRRVSDRTLMLSHALSCRQSAACEIVYLEAALTELKRVKHEHQAALQEVLRRL